MDELAKDLTIEMIPEGLTRQIAEEIGVDNLLKLADLAGGSALYLPKSDTLLRPVRDRRIKEDFNGYNYQTLANKYNVTERWVRMICGEGHLEGQQTLF